MSGKLREIWFCVRAKLTNSLRKASLLKNEMT
jgi:hypothetical protein